MVGPGARTKFLGNLAEVDVDFFFNGQEMNRSGIKKGQRGGGFHWDPWQVLEQR